MQDAFFDGFTQICARSAVLNESKELVKDFSQLISALASLAKHSPFFK